MIRGKQDNDWEISDFHGAFAQKHILKVVIFTEQRKNVYNV